MAPIFKPVITVNQTFHKQNIKIKGKNTIITAIGIVNKVTAVGLQFPVAVIVNAAPVKPITTTASTYPHPCPGGLQS